MSWQKGVDVIEDLLRRGHLERVPANSDEAEYLLDRSRRHLRTAEREAHEDPEIAYDALYAAARKALTAVLVQQGLRPTRDGGHEVVIEAAQAQLDPPAGPILRPYRRRLALSKPPQTSCRTCLYSRPGGKFARVCVRAAGA